MNRYQALFIGLMVLACFLSGYFGYSIGRFVGYNQRDKEK